MSTSLSYVDNYHVPHHKITFGDSPEMTNDPPPTYYNSGCDLGTEGFVAINNPSPLSQPTQNLIDALDSILDSSFEKNQLIENLEMALRQQPVAKHKQIFDIAQIIVHACRNVYGPKEDSSTVQHKEKHQPLEEEDFEASQSESDTEDAASEIYPQRRQSMSAKDRLELQESAQGSQLSQANSSKKVPKSKATSSSTKPLAMLQGGNTKRASTPSAMSQMTCDTASRQSSRLSSPEIMDTPPRIQDALEKEIPEDSEDADSALQSLIDQSTQEFIYDSHQQIKEFSSYADSPPAHTDLVRSLHDEESEGESTWSKGSQWLRLLERGEMESNYGSIVTALNSMNFRKWHEAKKLKYQKETPYTASRRVTDKLVGPKPANNYEGKTWKQRRNYIATVLTRAKKWNLLVECLGRGILFMKAAKLAKVRNLAIPFMAERLKNDPAKKAVLDILSKQIVYLMENRKTKLKEFEDELRDVSLKKNFPLPDCIPSTESIELDNLYQAISESATSGRLTVRNSRPPCDFNLTALQRLKGQTWLNDKLLVACLHLSERLSFVRIGWSITIHQDVRPEIPMNQQFERASQQIQAWKEDDNSQLAYFFPLYQHRNHFTLLEINEREGYVYHYDSLSGDNTDVKNACEQQFPHLPFREKEAMQQKDGDSCGFMVIKHAQNRMRGLQVDFRDGASIDSTSLRCEVINLLKVAWSRGDLVEAQIGSKRKRGAETEDEDFGETQRVVKALKY
ncbi:hypothetical protein MKX08_006536 [Trichoderma sp. CBMAI-0020]|nr:hypothetical protein MKX08_006536 [Trichoderma sp. CBMAI-0020]WOD46103.1 hypothetical protein [Trichoderma atroviride]